MKNKEIIFFYKRNKNKGSLMVELLVASAIIVGAFLASSGVAQKSLQVSRQSLHATQASFLLEEGAEAVRIIRDNAWINISGLSTSVTYYAVFSNGSWNLSSAATAAPSDGVVGIFTRTINIANVNRDANDDISASGTNDSGTKLITVTVTWQEGGTIVTKTLSFYITDFFS